MEEKRREEIERWGEWDVLEMDDVSRLGQVGWECLGWIRLGSVGRSVGFFEKWEGREEERERDCVRVCVGVWLYGAITVTYEYANEPARSARKLSYYKSLRNQNAV